MAGKSSKDTALKRYGLALDKVTAAEAKVRIAEAEASLEAQRYTLYGGTADELTRVQREKGFGSDADENA